MVRIRVFKNKNQQNCGKFIAFICSFKSDVSAVIAGEEINAKSIMRAPLIEKAAEIEFIIEGEDEKAAADAISTYFNRITK